MESFCQWWKTIIWINSRFETCKAYFIFSKMYNLLSVMVEHGAITGHRDYEYGLRDHMTNLVLLSLL